MPQSKQEAPTKEIASARKNITDQDRQVSMQAYTQYKEKKYTECLQQMKRLLEMRSHDPRVLSNKALVDYLVSKCCKTDEFVKHLETVKKQIEFGMVSSEDELDDIDQSFFLYNQAVLHYHLKQYKCATSILDRLYKIIEPLGDMLAAKVCVLFVEVYLSSNQLDQAFGMILYIESVILAPKSLDGKNERYNEIVKLVQPKLHIFKVRLYMTRGFYAQCKRELKLAMNSNKKSNEVLFLKGHVECMSCNFQKSIKLLNNTQKNVNEGETPYSIHTMYQNDLGVVHFYMRKFNLAVSCFKKAFEENLKFMKSLPPIEKSNSLSGRPLETLTMHKQAEIMYNMGVSLLFSGRASHAFDCLIEARRIYKCNPRYWLRLAECCIAAYQKTLETCSSSSHGSHHVQCVVGSGVHRKIILSPDHQQYNKQEASSAMPATTLEFANLCLSNASILLPTELVLEENMTKFLQNEKPVPGDEDKDGIKRSFIGRIFVDAPPGDPLQTKEIYYLKASILCCHAFVALGLGDYFKSEKFARALLRMSHVTGPQRFMAHVYLAESLIRLGKIEEAIQELSIENLKAYQMFDKEVENLKATSIFPKNLNEARWMMMLNMASTYCCWSEFEKCKLILRQIPATDLHPSLKTQAILLSVYCDLKNGKTSDALNLIKRSEIFPSGRLIDRVEAARVMSNVNQIPQNIMQQISLSELAGRKATGF